MWWLLWRRYTTKTYDFVKYIYKFEQICTIRRINNKQFHRWSDTFNSNPTWLAVQNENVIWPLSVNCLPVQIDFSSNSMLKAHWKCYQTNYYYFIFWVLVTPRRLYIYIFKKKKKKSVKKRDKKGSHISNGTLNYICLLQWL